MFYDSFINMHMPIILTAIDRDKDSKTYGSCDRNYWHLKIRDFSSAILQQSCLTLAIAYKYNYLNNSYYNNENIREWSIAALRYMGKIQLKDGSFNEYYPNEHGFPPTAFNLFAGCKTYKILELNDSEILYILKKSIDWICNHDEKRAFNQEIAALAGLALYREITKDNSLDDAINHKVELLLSVYCEEGWFPEQGGADIGYSSVALDMLVEYYELTKDERVIKPLHGMVKFLSHFVHPDGTIGGEYGSRNTIYFMPNGLEGYIYNGLDEENIAAKMIEKIYSNDKEHDDFMLAVDERYLAHYVMHSYLRALVKYNNRAVGEGHLPYEKEGEKWFENAGLLTIKNGNYYTIIAPSKGGILKIYNAEQETFWDCGYRIPIEPGKTAATNWLDNRYVVKKDDGKVEVSGDFNLVKQKVQNPVYHLGLRVLSKFLGDKVNKIIKKLTIFQKNEFTCRFKRLIKYSEEGLTIEDWIEGLNNRELHEASNISLRLVASGKFYSSSDILRGKLDNYGCIEKFHRIRTISFEDGSIDTKVD